MATGVSRVKWTQCRAEDLPQKSDLAAAELVYPGKKSAVDILGTKPAEVKPIWPPADHAKHVNRLYFAENLGVLSLLSKDPDVAGKVRLVYIDPPYSTNSVFQSRKQTHAYADLLTGAAYLEFMRERLILLRGLLSEDGSIYVHLDQKMAFHVKILMDEIFGLRNFRNLITRKKCHSKNYTRKAYGDVTDYLLFYTKREKYVWNRPSEEWTTKKVLKEYPYIDEKTGRRYKKVPIHAPGTRNGETGKPWRGMYPPPGKHWQYTPRALDLLDAKGEIYWSPNGNPRRKIFFDNNKGFMVPDLWLEFPDAHNQNIYVTGYPTEKNPALLERLLTPT